MKKLLRHILIGLAAAGFVLAAGAVLLFNRPTLGWQLLSVPTGSMRPTMGPGSLVLVHKVPLSSLKVGDVITHTNVLTMRSTLTHRIIKEYKIDGKIPAFITKGDANPSPDPPVVGGLVKGKMVAHVPYVGELFMWAKTWTGITVLIYIPALIIMIQETRRLAAYLKQMKPYHLEGWEPKHGGMELSMPAVPAIAASAAMVVVLTVAGIAWGTAGAHAAQDRSIMLLILPHNEIATKSVPPTGTNTQAPQTDCTVGAEAHAPTVVTPNDARPAQQGGSLNKQNNSAGADSMADCQSPTGSANATVSPTPSNH